jgi:endonuclease YncB( thermonuclease family)
MKNITLIVGFLLLLTIACATSADAPTAPPQVQPATTTAPIPQPPSTPSPHHPVTPAPPLPTGDLATVTWVIDGDTIEVELDGREVRVRYIGIDTPERDMPFYEEATEANRQLVEGQSVLLVKDVSETDRFGRLLRYIYLQDGAFVNAQLVGDGYAQAVTFPPDVAFADHFRQLQEEARLAGRGLWAE